MSKLTEWYDSLPEQTKTWLKNQPIYKESDVWKFVLGGAVIGFAIGFLVGYEVAWRPIVNCFRPLVG